MSGLTKYAGAVLIRPFDWTAALMEGDTITGTPALTVTPPGLTVVFDSNEGNLTWLRFEDGIPGQIHTITLTAQTAGGETLIGKPTITIRAE